MNNSKPSKLQEIRNSNSSAFKSFVAGMAGGIMGVLFTCPLEVVKTRYQSTVYTPLKGFTGVFRGLYEIAVNEGVRGLWRGGLLMAASVAPSRAFHFFVTRYENAKGYLTKHYSQTPVLNAFISSIMAGTVAVTVTCPIWVIKTRLQLSHYTNNPRTIMDITREIYGEAKFKGFFKGLNASYLGLCETALQFTLYEYLKRYSDSQYKLKGKNTPKWRAFLDAAVSKLVATLCTYPHEVVRTRLRENGASSIMILNSVMSLIEKYKGLVDCFVRIYKDEGLKALYGGCYAHVLRVVPNAAIMFMTVELILGQRV